MLLKSLKMVNLGIITLLSISLFAFDGEVKHLSIYSFNRYYLVQNSIDDIYEKFFALDQEEKIDYQTFSRKGLVLLNFQTPNSWDQDCVLLVDSIDTNVSIIRLLKVSVDLPKENDSIKYKLFFEQHILSELDWCGN